MGSTGAPLILDNTLSVLEAKVTQQMDVGTHTVFVGEVVGTEVIREGEPMTYAYYHQVKRGTTPKSAPTYRGARGKERNLHHRATSAPSADTFTKQEKGDPDGGIAPGTPFGDIPDSWTCPVCGAAKDQFKEV